MSAEDILGQMHWATHRLNSIPKINKLGQYQTTLNITVKKRTGKRIKFLCQGQTIDLTHSDIELTQEILDALFPEIIKLYAYYLNDVNLSGIPISKDELIFLININL